MEIFRAGPEQFADVLVLLEEYYAAVGVLVRDTPEQVREYLLHEGGGVWLATADGVAAGCVVLRSMPPVLSDLELREQGERAAECKRLYVRPRFRGQRIAHKLLDAMEAHARAVGVEWIYLDSKDDLRDAIRLYRSRGYVECERYNSNPQATIFLRRAMGVEGPVSGAPHPGRDKT